MDISKTKIKLDNIVFPSLIDEDNRNLISNIKDLEIKEVINQCGTSKSLGPDGFNFHFIKNNWETIKNDVIQEINYFQYLDIYCGVVMLHS